MKKIKIFYFIPNLQQGGPERQILEIIRRLPDRFEPVLCLYEDNIFFKRELPTNQPRYILGSKKMNLAMMKKLIGILRYEKPTILHSYRDKSNFWARIAALRAGVPVIISSCRNRMMQIRYLLVEKLLSDRCQMVLTNSEGVKKELTSWAKVDGSRIRVIYNILDTNRYRLPSEDERIQARQKWNLAADHRVLILPGRIGIQKNQIGLLMALDRLARDHEIPPITLLLVGRRRDLLTARIVEILAKKKSLRRMVRFFGSQTDMPSLYWASDVLVMPSLWEGLSNAALEACASGLPGILSHAANIDRIVVDGETGFEVPTCTVAPLMEAIRKILNEPMDRLRQMGTLGRRHVTKRFAPHPDYMVERTVEVYDRLLEEQSL